MASRERRDGGQVILLAGILLVLAFILFSTQLALLSSLGQQSGRETENPLLDDYLLMRRTLENQWGSELQNDTGVFVCPDMVVFGKRITAQLDLMEGLEKGRSNGFTWSNFTLRRDNATALTIGLTVAMYDDATSIADRLAYDYTCTSGTIQGPATCNPSPAVCTLILR